jgi:hypothetical protein
MPGAGRPSSLGSNAETTRQTAEPGSSDSTRVPPPAEQILVPVPAAVEIGGREGPEPTRFGDWEKNGRCIDF